MRARLAADWDGLRDLARASRVARFYRTGFDAQDAFACERLAGDAAADDLYRWAYRALFLKALNRVPLPAARPLGEPLEPFTELAAMAREGEAVAARLVAGAEARHPAIEELSIRGDSITVMRFTVLRDLQQAVGET